MPETTFSLQAPHEEALAIIRGKAPVAKAVFDNLLPELKARVFTVSGIESANVLQRVRDSIAGLAEGRTWDQAKDDVVAELDPWLGDGSERRAELLLRTHGFQAFQAANWQTAQEDTDTTHLQYLTMEDERVRDTHAALDGIILPKGDPFWNKHYPPWEWGCRCLARTMNGDQVDDARDEDEDKAPDDQRVIEGPALRKLNEGTLIRDGQTFDVSAPSEENPDAFHWHPDDLRIPLSDLKPRYDAAVWDQFVDYAKTVDLDSGQSLFDWLNQTPSTDAKPRRSRKAKAKLEPEPQNSIVANLISNKFSPAIQQEAAKMTARAVELGASANFAATRGGAHYTPITKTINLTKDPESWSGHPITFNHEMGHHLHHESQTITGLGRTGMKPEFAAAMEKDFKAWTENVQSQHGDQWREVFNRRNPYGIVEQIAKDMGLPAYDSSDITSKHRISRIADTISGLSWGKYGTGHALSYMKERGHMEVFAHAYSAAMDGDAAFQKLFTNVSEYVKKEFGFKA